jgi:hypothetical protein
MLECVKLLSRIWLSIAVLYLPISVTAQQLNQTEGTPVRMVVGVEPKHGNGLPTITQQDELVYQGRNRRPVTGWVPARGEQASLALAILIDDSSGISFGSQIEDLRAFIGEQAPTTLVALGYMQNGTVFVAQQFTQDHAAVAKALRLPQGFAGAEASPYFWLVDLIKNWPTNTSTPADICISLPCWLPRSWMPWRLVLTCPPVMCRARS